ncbi:hypothetical protein EMPS_00310 [Entomortierella parvispora]|uniref:Galactose oxidase n=1 Tax=Entomortierella parvispora TaxID=205924 RepID=A0A9P3H0E0_9FUNG|nr:hypothetical protein EMPS_00310 [Entomortierella parvispora]
MTAARSHKGRAVLLLGLCLACLNLANAGPSRTTTQADPSPSSPYPSATTTTASIISPSLSPSPSSSLSPSSPSIAPTPTPTPSSSGASASQPSAVYGMAYGSNGNQLFIQGGKNASGSSFQYFGLNLKQEWSASAAAWTNLEIESSSTASPAPGTPAGPMAVTVEAVPSTLSGYSGTTTKGGSPIVVGVEDGGSPRLYAFNSTQWNPVSYENSFGGQFEASSIGPLIVTDPTVGTIYFLGDGLKLTLQSLPPQSQPATLASLSSSFRKLTPGSAAAWSTAHNGILAATNINGQNMDVQLYTPDVPTSTWVSLNATVPPGTTISSRTGHCFVSNDDGSKFYLFGGVNNSHTYLSDLYELDVSTNAWTQLNGAPTTAGRAQMACTVSGTVLIAWGGSNGTEPTDALPLLYNTTVADWVQSFNPVQSSAIPPLPTTVPGPSTSKKSNTGAIAGGVVAAVAVCVIVAGFLVVRKRRQTRRGSLPKNGGSFADYSHAKMSRGSIDKNGPPQDSTMGQNRYTYIASPFADDAQEQVQMRSMSPGMSPPSHQYSDGPVSVHPSSISSYSIPAVATSQYDNTQLSSALSYASYSQNQDPTQSRRLSQLPPPIPPPQTRPEVQPIVLTSEGQQLPPATWFDDEPRMTSRAQQDDGGYDDDRSSIVSAPRSAGAPSAVELIPIEDYTTESEGFLSRSNTLASSTAGGRKAGKASRERLHPPQENDEEGTRRDSTESLDYLDVA